MTVTETILSGLAALAILGVVCGLTRFLRWRITQLDAKEKHLEVFYDAANNLISDDGTPETVVDSLQYLSAHIADPRIGRTILVQAIYGELRDAFKRPPADHKRYIDEIARMPEPLRRQYSIAICRGMIVATFSNVFLGPVIRRLVLYWGMNDNEFQNASIVYSDVSPRVNSRVPRREMATV